MPLSRSPLPPVAALSVINHLIDRFVQAFRMLDAPVPLAEVERMALLVHRSMNGGQRAYHTVGHVLAVCEQMNARQTLAALLHDVVYCQLDGGFPVALATLLNPLLQVQGDGLTVRTVPAEMPDVRLLAAAYRIFGVEPEQSLSLFAGGNELASAIVAVRLLSPWLNADDLLAVVACIEATIPFRAVDATGKGAPEALLERLQRACQPLGGSCTAAALHRMTRDAVQFANQDVAGFAEPDPGRFLSGTWLLIEESSAPLAAVGVYSVRDYRQALGRMAGFFRMLDARQVFRRFDDEPDHATFARMVAAAENNLAFSRRYLAAKLAAIAVIEAVAESTGGDCPVSMLLGDIRGEPGEMPCRIEHFLPLVVLAPEPPDIDPLMLDVLVRGRHAPSACDLSESPLTAYFYRNLGEAGMAALFVRAQQWFAGEMPATVFLAGIPAALRDPVLQGCMEISLSRRDAVQSLQQALYPAGA